ncbi:serine/threonine-protein kinase [Bailinhaonella thermotolerans]|uniref:serine/threonine-protein kinase n=1 Tax=Bailinhaonella thermotolerans TaxID=1070861 RepID=UPI00192A1E40|nr:serine/threonine-protein kinase [Bailinhaonella thermotolerans]
MADPLEPGDPGRFGDYIVAGRLGSGGQGIVYLAHAPGGEPVAVKVLLHGDRESRTRLARELAAVQSVASFCTARVLASSLDGPRPYVVSEFVDGPSLAERVRERGPVAGGELERLFVGTVTALVAIHSAGVVHRDFKPGNVLLGPDGPRVVDFGIAQRPDVSTLTSGVIGTPAYLAPEQIAGHPASPASDVFAWAATMVFAASGRSPFSAETIPAVISRIVGHEPDLAAVPPQVRDVVAGALAKDPAARPTAHQILVRLIDPSGLATAGTVPGAAGLPGAPGGPPGLAAGTAGPPGSSHEFTAGTAGPPGSSHEFTADTAGAQGGSHGFAAGTAGAAGGSRGIAAGTAGVSGSVPGAPVRPGPGVPGLPGGGPGAPTPSYGGRGTGDGHTGDGHTGGGHPGDGRAGVTREVRRRARGRRRALVASAAAGALLVAGGVVVWANSGGDANGPSPLAGRSPANQANQANEANQTNQTDAAKPTPTRPEGANRTPPGVLAADTFDRQVTGGFGRAETGGAWVNGEPVSAYSVSGGAAHVLMRGGPSDGRAYLGEVIAKDTDIAFAVRAGKAPPAELYVVAVPRRVDAGGLYKAVVTLAPGGAVTLQLEHVDTAGERTVIAAWRTVPGVASTGRLRVRAQAVGSGPTTLRAKVWADGTPEPAWQATGKDGARGMQAAGYPGIGLHLDRKAGDSALKVSLDEVKVSKPRG